MKTSQTPLLYRNVSSSERKSITLPNLMDRFNMLPKKNLFPGFKLSGGQQQLVGIA